MVRRRIEVGSPAPLLDISSYARRRPMDRVPLAQEEIPLLSRTVRRTPEVMVNVLTKGASNLKAVGRHLSHLSRDGEVEIQTDDGRRLTGQGVEQELLEDWDLDLEEARGTRELRSRPGIVRRKLLHKLVLSMPAGTPADGLLRGARTFARETLGAQHRYATVLHTDEPHPHVHMVKAVSEAGVRLNMRKATLREWRREFALQLRAQGINANATDKPVRGSTRANLSDGMYRAMQRGASRRIQQHVGSTAMERKTASEASGKESLLHTRAQVERGWLAAAEILDREGQRDLGWQVRRFIEALAPIRTDRELLGQALRSRDRRPRHSRPVPPRSRGEGWRGSR